MVGNEGFERHLRQVNLTGTRLGYVLSAVLMPGGSILDWAVEPQHGLRFLAWRGLASVAALLLLSLTYTRWGRRRPVLLGAGAPLVCAVTIEAMVLELGSATSHYYAGLNLCILAVGVLYTWRWQSSLAVSAGILLIWLVPAAAEIAQGSVEARELSNNLFFIAMTTVISVASTVARYRSAAREFRARERLAATTEELGSTLEQLKELDQLKNEFFANVSHELRTPLTLIVSPVEALLAKEQDPGARESLMVVRANARRLLKLIEDLLDLARLDTGGLRLRVAPFDWCQLVADVARATRPALEAAGVTFEVALPDEPCEVRGDAHRLESVVTNLLGNALKFTPRGGTIRAAVERTDAETYLSIADSGPGVPTEDQERIFQRFYQVQGSERRRHGGAGIGLALARELTELHGGRLEVASPAGMGATFTLALPIGGTHVRPDAIERRSVRLDEHPGRRQSDPASDGESRASTETPPPPLLLPPSEQVRLEGGRRARVLVVEDEPDLRRFIEVVLGPLFDTETAEDGHKGLALTRSTHPDLVLSDIMMPDSSGIDLCRAIKADPLLKRTPVIFLTARTGASSTLEGYAAGAEDFVSKPFHPRVLIARITAQLRLRSLSLQLADQARLASAGTLGAGIAHEVKNPLNAIVNSARLLTERATDSDEMSRKLLDVIQNGAERIEAIVTTLEEHVRPADDAGSGSLDIHSGLRSTLKLLAHRTQHIGFHLDFAGEGSLLGPRRALNQVFLNLVDNAVRSGATNIWISTEVSEDAIELRIADDGPGIPHEVAELVFQPFFTTRPVGEGTGLGLYLCRRIVEDCGGTLRHEPRRPNGTMFLMRLPKQAGQP